MRRHKVMKKPHTQSGDHGVVFQQITRKAANMCARQGPFFWGAREKALGAETKVLIGIATLVVGDGTYGKQYEFAGEFRIRDELGRFGLFRERF